MLTIKTFEDRYDSRKIFHHVNILNFKFRIAVKKDRAYKRGNKKRKYFSFLPKSIYYTNMGYSYDGKNLYTLTK